MLTIKDAYKDVIGFKQAFEERYVNVTGATSDFELISGVVWSLNGEQDEVEWEDKEDYNPDQEYFEYGYEVNYVEYEDDFCIHFVCDDGCGNRHLNVVFLKSDQIGED